MDIDDQKFISQVPELDLAEYGEMLTDFSREAQRHLISARNSLLVLETVPSDKEAIENTFKTFHTIKGLADFLELRDICCLTHEAELMTDMIRKGQLEFEPHITALTTSVIDGLQGLLELLDEQIANGGNLKSDYLDVTETVESLKDINSKKVPTATAVKIPVKNIPMINFEPDMSVCSQMEEKLKTASKELTVDKESLKKLVEEFQDASKGLKEVQSKLAERQRELIKERELAIKLTQQAQEEARSKSEYLANMSHEIRTLINAILGFTDLLKEGSLPDKQRDHVDTIIMSGNMLLEIVNNILDFSKVESGKLKLEQIEFDLEHTVEEVFKIIRTRLNSKPIDLYFSIEKGLPKTLIGDPMRLKQIFINLLENAIKFTESGQIGLEISTENGKRALDGNFPLKFVVRDTGIGIPEDRQKAVFESFTQADDSTTRLYGGSGLGLALCKTFVESMNGKIWVESTLGQGSCFSFAIILPEGKQAADGVDEALVDKFAGAGVMIVTPGETTAQALEKVCGRLKMNVLNISAQPKQASEALLKLEEDNNLPDVVFIDATMPGQNGLTLASRIKQQGRYGTVKLAAVSCDVKLETTGEYQEAGFDFFLAKPIIEREMIEAIRNLLGEDVSQRRVVTDEMLQNTSCSGVKVLVAEDSLPNQELLKVHFESLGCECEYVKNGQEALEILRDKTFDICFMDLQMPMMGGLEASSKIRGEMGLDLPIVALTAADVQDEKEKCLNAGMTDYLPKPFGVEELKEKVIKNVKI